MEAVGRRQRTVVAAVSAAIGASVWVVTMASVPRTSSGPEQDLGNNAFFWILLAGALVGGFLLPSCATVIGVALGLPALLLSPWTAPRGDNDGLWILIVPALVVFLLVLVLVARVGAWLRERSSQRSA
jgi:membrane protease YdiL (CAAX protease family)